MIRHEAGVAAHDGDALCPPQGVLDTIAAGGDDCLPPGHDLLDVDSDGAFNDDAILGCPPSEVGGVGAGHHCLGRCAPGVDAGSTEPGALDDRHTVSRGCEATGQGWASLPAR